MLILLSAIPFFVKQGLTGIMAYIRKTVFSPFSAIFIKMGFLTFKGQNSFKKKKVKEKRKSTTKVSTSVPDCGNKAKIQDEALYCTSCSNILGSPILRPLQIGCSCSLYCRENFNQRNSEAHKSKLDTPLTGGKDGKNH